MPYFGINPPNADRKENQAKEIAGKFGKTDRFLKNNGRDQFRDKC
jgi:hypothetical protein